MQTRWYSPPSLCPCLSVSLLLTVVGAEVLPFKHVGVPGKGIGHGVYHARVAQEREIEAREIVERIPVVVGVEADLVARLHTHLVLVWMHSGLEIHGHQG
jgi:hypothetical protein